MTSNIRIAIGLVFMFLGGAIAGYQLHSVIEDPIIAEREAAYREFQEELRLSREALEAEKNTGRGVQEILGLR